MTCEPARSKKKSGMKTGSKKTSTSLSRTFWTSREHHVILGALRWGVVVSIFMFHSTFNAWFPKQVLTSYKKPSQKKRWRIQDAERSRCLKGNGPSAFSYASAASASSWIPHSHLQRRFLKKRSWKSICKCMRQEIRVYNSWSIKIYFGPVTPFKSSCAFWWRTSGAEKDLTDLARTKFQYFWRHVKTKCPKTQGTSSRLWLRSLWGLVVGSYFISSGLEMVLLSIKDIGYHSPVLISCCSANSRHWFSCQKVLLEKKMHFLSHGFLSFFGHEIDCGRSQEIGRLDCTTLRPPLPPLPQTPGSGKSWPSWLHRSSICSAAFDFESWTLEDLHK